MPYLYSTKCLGSALRLCKLPPEQYRKHELRYNEPLINENLYSKYHSDMCKINVLYVTREAVEAAAAVEANSKAWCCTCKGMIT